MSKLIVVLYLLSVCGGGGGRTPHYTKSESTLDYLNNMCLRAYEYVTVEGIVIGPH